MAQLRGFLAEVIIIYNNNSKIARRTLQRMRKKEAQKKRLKKAFFTIATMLALVAIMGVNLIRFDFTGFQAESMDHTPYKEVVLDHEIPLSPTPVFQIPVPSALGIHVKENYYAIIDYSNASYGYIMAKLHQQTLNRHRLVKTAPNGVRYIYTLKPEKFGVFPLSEGNGTYVIKIYEHVQDIKYKRILKTYIDVFMYNPLSPFLRPNQLVNFNQDSEVARVARQLTMGLECTLDKVTAVYNFIIENITYDFYFAETVESGYLPDLDQVLKRGKGICFDFAALMTAMLRSQGIPARMVFGYTAYDFHAWVSVFSEVEGWVNDTIFFKEQSWRIMDPTFTSTSNSGARILHIGDGKNYESVFYY